ncbi:amidohydrolase [Arsenicicoccus sp. oral taxon 190]|uniref:amidohydrolase n=1 Tax=Arsenicicoccus sp. oral taxon 190 TaxID=1658671 RepID=UPI00067A3EA9|nr:amidohydrolase [Arsenicicoccus sp. oral taxon 190]AKT52438.1 N-acyl-L-amino acid amidohydrolase [Arsenicicoccus sp. oral taxon 190]
MGSGHEDRQIHHDVLTDLASLEPELVALRRDIHAHPELGFAEQRTTTKVSKRLRAADLHVTPMHPTGLVVDIGAAEPQRRVAVRADIDALPLTERTGLPFASTVAGACHACGHDVHTTCLVGLGLVLAPFHERWREQGLAVRLLFQPAEEVMPGGAHAMVQAGHLRGVDLAYALHCDPTVDVGEIGLRTGPITAATDILTVRLRGRGGHTSRPHLTQDLTYALATVVKELPAVLSRRVDPRAGLALVWGTIEAGGAPNVIPSSGAASGTLRILDADVWDAIGPLCEEVVAQLAAPYGVEVEIDHRQGVPPVVNAPAAVAHVVSGATTMLGPHAVGPTPQSLGGEDFSWMLRDVPGALMRLGTRTPGGATYDLHRPDLVVDERAIGVGVKVLAGTVLAALA